MNCNLYCIFYNKGKIILYVVFTERKGDIRIISARIANDAERKVYYGKKRN